MLKKTWRTYCHFLLIAGMVLLLIVANYRDKQPLQDTPEHLAFQGEYSCDDGRWYPLEEKVKLSARGGELVLRGSFDRDIPEGSMLSFYAEHIQYRIVMNGQILSVSPAWDQQIQPYDCDRHWHTFQSPGIRTSDVIEIHLKNQSRAAKADAYHLFLRNFYLGDRSELQDMLAKQNAVARMLGMIVLGISFGVMGISIAFLLMKIREGKSIWTLGFLSFCIGAYIILDTPDMEMVNSLNTFNTYASALAVMMASLEMSIFLGIFIHGSAKKTARGIMFAHSSVTALLMIAGLAGWVSVFQMGQWWMRFQLLISPIQIGCCIIEIRRVTRPRANLLVSCSLLVAACMVDILNEAFFLWENFSLAKLTFLLVFLVHIVKGILGIPAAYQNAIQAEQLRKDLKDSQITMAMSQIRTHFVFNVLNAVSGMCKYDPEKADTTIVRFSRYLRTNIDIMSNNQPVDFETALQYLEDYMVLEQIRFGDKIEFDMEIGVEDFQIPPLVLQPLVENAIKHGLTCRHEGGRVMLRTWEDEDNIYLTVEDDGVGFEKQELEKQNSVGLKNVRFRLEHMMNGSLRVESKRGSGTVVTITIPQKEARKCM